MSLATKYRPSRFEDMVEQKTIVNIVESLCQKEDLENRNFLFIGPAGCGKAQPLGSNVLTTCGFKQMRDIKLGEEVFTSNGNTAKVSGIYPQGIRPIYEITLSDGCKIRVSDEHLNVVYRYNEDKKKREDFTLTTLDLLDLFQKSRFRLRIDIPEVDWPDQPVPIDPYLLGALIGDGSFSSGNCSFSNTESDVIQKVDDLLHSEFNCYLEKLPGENVDYVIKKSNFSKNKYWYSFRGQEIHSQAELVDALEAAGYPRIDPGTIHRMLDGHTSSRARQFPELLEDIKIIADFSVGFQKPHPVLEALDKLDLLVPSVKKHIPSCYLFNSREVRKRLLQGLMDTDGYTDAYGYTSFSTSSPQLSEDFGFLVRSLGIRDHTTESSGSYKGKAGQKIICHTSYNHDLKISDDFKDYVTSKKHLARWTKKQHSPMRNILSIEYVGDEECQCIYVDHDDHTYISDGFIPTHNTTTARIMANVLNDGKGEPIEIDAASHNGVDSVREIVNQARMYPVGSKYKVFVIDECFPGDANISTPEGFKRMQDVQIGDVVLAKDQPRFVLDKFVNKVPTSRLICLHISNAIKIITTVDHKFYSDGQWVEAKNLVRGASLYPADVQMYDSEIPLSRYMLLFSEMYIPGKNDNVFLSSIPQEDLDSGIVTFYDLAVEAEHCYFVNGILVHNCHSFSQQAWQMFLKPLEDAPAKSIFIFCTTNPEKIPATIISRVQTFQLSKISLQGIHDRLEYVLQQEGYVKRG